MIRIPEDLVSARIGAIQKITGGTFSVPTRTVAEIKAGVKTKPKYVGRKIIETTSPTTTQATEVARQVTTTKGVPSARVEVTPSPLTTTPFEAIQREARYTPAQKEKRFLPEYKLERLKDQPVIIQKLGKYVVKPLYDPVRESPVKTAVIFGASFALPFLPIANVATRIPRIAKAVKYGLPTAYVGAKTVEVVAAPKGERLGVVRRAVVTEIAPAIIGGKLGAAAKPFVKPYAVARFRSIKFAGKWRIPTEVSPESRGFPFKAEGGFAVPVKSVTREAMMLTPPKEFQFQLKPKPYEPLPPLRTVKRPTPESLLTGVKRPQSPFIVQRGPVKVLIRQADIPKQKLTQLKLTKIKPTKPEFAFRQPQLEYKPSKRKLFGGKKAQVLEPMAVPERVYKRLITPIETRLKPTTPRIESIVRVKKEMLSNILFPTYKEKQLVSFQQLKTIQKPIYKEILTHIQIQKVYSKQKTFMIQEVKQRQVLGSALMLKQKQLQKVVSLTKMKKPQKLQSRLRIPFPKPPRKPIIEKLPPIFAVPKLELGFTKRKVSKKKKKKKLLKGVYKPSLFGLELGKTIKKAPKLTSGIGVRLPVA